MFLSLAPLVVSAASLVIAAVLLCRRLPRPGEVLGVSCVRCGMPAAALAHDSFVCPGCGRDVREAGLAPARGRSPTRPFWTVTAYTVAVLVVAPITAAVAEQAAPRVEAVTSEATFAAPRSRAYAGVVVTTASSGPPGAPHDWTSQTLAELTALDGRATLLEIERPPGRWRITADDGRTVEQGQALDEEAVLRWYRAAGLDTGDPRVRSEVADVLPNLAEPPRQMRTESPPLRVAPGMGFDSRGARSGSSSGRVTRIAPVVVAGWSVVWVLGLWTLLRPARAGATKPTPSAPSVSPAAGGVTP